MNDRNQKCLKCGWLINIPPFGYGECSIHEAAHKQKEYCEGWTPLKREDAYCNPSCVFYGRLVRERPADMVADSPESRNLSTFPPGSTLKRETDVDEARAGAPLYFVVDWGHVVKLDPKTRSRSECDIPGFTSMCAV